MAAPATLVLRGIQPGPGEFLVPKARPAWTPTYAHGTGPFFQGRARRRQLLRAFGGSDHYPRHRRKRGHRAHGLRFITSPLGALEAARRDRIIALRAEGVQSQWQGAMNAKRSRSR